MSAHRSIIAGLLLALPSAAVLAQDNPWRVPSAPGGYLPPYAVQDFGSAQRFTPPAPRLQAWSQEPAYAEAPPPSVRQDFEGFGRGQWRGAPGWYGNTTSGQPAMHAGPPRQAALNAQGRYDVAPAAGLSQGFGQTWSSGPGYGPPSMATGSLPEQRSYRHAPMPPVPITQFPMTGGYAEYPPLDEAAAAPNRREAPVQRAGATDGWGPRSSTPAGPELFYGPSLLTAPYGGLPGPGGYGYGGLHGAYGYPAAPYPPGW